MPQKGKNKGNTHAALPQGQRGRIQWTQGLSGDDLMKIITHLKISNLDDAEIRKKLREQSEKLFENWLNSL